jgi:hypothetical protein
MTARCLLHPALLLVALLSLAPAGARAEGAVRVLACDSTRVCDAVGDCRSDTGSLTLRMAPEALAADGSGRYELTLGGDVLPMQALTLAGDVLPMQAVSEAGPFLWQQADTRYTLLVNSNSDFVLHALSLSPQPSASLRYLRCTFRQ